MFIDTHAHLNFEAFSDEYDEVIKRAFDNNVGAIINVGSNYATSRVATRMAHEYEKHTDKHECKIYAAVGLHPIHLIKDVVESSIFDGNEYAFKTKQEVFDYEKYKKLAQSSNPPAGGVVAIGETGIDLFRLEDDKHSIKDIIKLQSSVFRQHIKLAKELDLPLIIHSRDDAEGKYSVYDLMLEIIKKEKYYRGVVHCFVGTLAQAKKYIDLGFYIGFTGIVTFKNATEVQNVVKDINLNKILIETDSPFLAPVPYRGKRNEPAYVVEVAKKIAEIKNVPFEQVEKQTTENAIKLFVFDKPI